MEEVVIVYKSDNGYKIVNDEFVKQAKNAFVTNVKLTNIFKGKWTDYGLVFFSRMKEDGEWQDIMTFIEGFSKNVELLRSVFGKIKD